MNCFSLKCSRQHTCHSSLSARQRYRKTNGPLKKETKERKNAHLPMNCTGLDPSFSQQTPNLEGSRWEVWGLLLSGLEDLGPPGNDGMEDSPPSLDSALVASPPAPKPQSIALTDVVKSAQAVSGQNVPLSINIHHSTTW